MDKLFNIFFITALSGFFISCTQEPAKVEYHLNDFYGYNESGEKISVLDTGEEITGPKQISAEEYNKSEYKIDKYQAPSDIEIEEIDSLKVVESSLPERSEQIRQNEYQKSTTGSGDSKTINISEQTHRVAQGETLFAISRKYNIPILPIIIINNLTPPYNLNVGQTIKIPEARFHSVTSKETLYSISRKYGVDMNALVKSNRLQAPYDINIGQKLQIPFPTYQPKPQIASKIAKESVSAKKEVQSDNSENNGEIKLVTDNSPVLKPKGLSISIPPTLKPIHTKAPTYKTALLRKELTEKRSVRQKSYKDDGKFTWPVKGKLKQKFGMQKNNEYNDGIYISAPAGAFVKASLSGKVVYTGDSLKSYGNLIIIKHNNGLLSAYAHLSNIAVKKDDFVKKGQVIGKIGQTGKIKSPQLYFAIRKGKEARDPMMYLR